MSYETKQRDILLNFFKMNRDKSFSASEIFEKLKKKNISLSAIYRNLAELEHFEKVRKTTKNGSKCFFYQFVDCVECNGHVHLSCTKCGKIIHLSEKDSQNLSSSLLKNSKFNLDTKTAVLFGECESCTKKKKVGAEK